MDGRTITVIKNGEKYISQGDSSQEFTAEMLLFK
jgi:hypothetical protein